MKARASPILRVGACGESPGALRGARRHLHEHPIRAEGAWAYLEAHRDEVRRPDLEIATFVLVEAGESVVHNTALLDPERLDDPRFIDEVCDLMERYLAK